MKPKVHPKCKQGCSGLFNLYLSSPFDDACKFTEILIEI